MKFGKIRVEENQLKFMRMMKSCIVPCEDIRWAYRRREDVNGKLCCGVATFTTNFVIVLTRMGKRYQFEMTEDEAKVCLKYLKECNPDLIVGFPKGGTLETDSVFNTRDLGGFRTEDGQHILPYQLLRSGELYHLSENDSQLLTQEYKLGTVVDFRTETEKAAKPDMEMEQVLYIDNPILEADTLGITQEKAPMDMIHLLEEINPETYMIGLYQKMVMERESQNQFAKFLQYVVNQPEDKSILWHCSLGKDRVGVATMLVLSALGIPKGTIIDDYMNTNTCLKQEQDYLVRMLSSKKVSDKVIDKLQVLYSAREAFIQSAYSTMLSEYGTMERYLRRAVCLSAGNVKKLKNRYLV